ncbi:MAG: lipopolysaccharide biosynthesis protein [Acidimicrobiia bacterium]|nr:lipopolysaccharide biosynthesis protein [Acidimicrobiia bacterium]
MTSAAADGHVDLDLTGRTGRSLLWSGAGFLAQRVLGFAMTVVLARLFVPDQFGLTAALMTFVLYAQTAIDLGTGTALIYERGTSPERLRVAMTINAVTVVALTALGFVAAPWLAEFFHVPESVALFRVTSLTVLLMGAGAIPTVLLVAELDFKRRTFLNLANSGLRAVIAITLAVLGFGVWAFVWGAMAGALVGTILAFVFTRLVPRFGFRARVALELLGFGLPMTGIRLIETFGLNADYLVVGNVLGPAALGAYTLAYRLPEMLLDSVYWTATEVLFPAYARAREVRRRDVGEAMLRALKLLVLYGGAVGVGLALVAQDVTDLVYGSKWTVAGGVMALIALKMSINSVNNGIGDVFPALGKPHLLFGIDVVVVGLQIPAFIYATRWGILGVAAVHLAAQLAFSAALTVVGLRLVRVPLGRLFSALQSAAFAVAGIVVLALPPRLLLPPGGQRLALTVVAGVLGGGLGLWLGGRDAVDEVVDLARATTGRREPAL